MFSGVAEQTFGPAEIDIMRRAIGIAAQALRREGEQDMTGRLHAIARSILRLTAQGQLDPLVLSACALREERAMRLQSFAPYERRPMMRRGHARRSGSVTRSVKIA